MFVVRILPIAWIFFAVNAWSADPNAEGSKEATGTATQQSGALGSRSIGKSETTPPVQDSVVQDSVVRDFKGAKQVCGDLTGEPREACEARAAATAESPRGRGGADPTGTGRAAAGESGASK